MTKLRFYRLGDTAGVHEWLVMCGPHYGLYVNKMSDRISRVLATGQEVSLKAVPRAVRKKARARIAGFVRHSPWVLSSGELAFTPETAHEWSGPWPGDKARFELKDVALFSALSGTSLPREADRHLGYATIEKPYVLYVYGNDDTSYSQTFENDRDAKDMIELLTGNQPLAFGEFVAMGFHFTN